jgi:hypothetical protein
VAKCAPGASPDRDNDVQNQSLGQRQKNASGQRQQHAADEFSRFSREHGEHG